MECYGKIILEDGFQIVGPRTTTHVTFFFEQ